MKKYILPFMVVLAACNSNTEAKKVEVKPEDIQVVEAIDNNPQLYFTATGTSPASSIEVTSLSTGQFTVKYTIDGTAAELSMTKESMVKDGKQNVQSGEMKFSGSGASLMLVASECAGGTHTCTLTIGERAIEACGKFVE